MDKIQMIKIIRSVEIEQLDIVRRCPNTGFMCENGTMRLSLKKAKDIADELIDKKEKWLTQS